MNVVQAGRVDLSLPSETDRTSGNERFAYKLTIDDLPDGVLIVLFADIFAGQLARHEGTASACRAAFRPNLVVAALKETCLMLRF